jgi:hypothetical protein
MRAILSSIIRNKPTIHTCWARRIRPYSTSKAITAINLFSHFNFIKSKAELIRLLDQKDIILPNTGQMPKGVTDLAIEKVTQENEGGHYRISANFSSSTEGVEAYQRIARELSGNEDVKLQNTFSLGFAKISMDLDTFLKKIEEERKSAGFEILKTPNRLLE